jgi:cytochrome c biogenesis protein CcmG/thiol:disulfide interchange protein DsbE
VTAPVDVGPTGGQPADERRHVPAALIAAIVGVVAVLLVVLLATRPSSTDRPSGSPLVGKPAPPLVATDTQGRTVDVASYRGRWLLINFFATWCGPCKVEHPQLVAFDQQGRASGTAAVVSVAFDDEPSAVAKFFAENGGDWPIVAEGNAAIALDYGVVKLPESYLVDPDGTIVEKIEGGVTADALFDRITGTRGGS